MFRHIYICLYTFLTYVQTHTRILGASNLSSPLLKSMQNIFNFSFIFPLFQMTENRKLLFSEVMDKST